MLFPRCGYVNRNTAFYVSGDCCFSLSLAIQSYYAGSLNQSIWKWHVLGILSSTIKKIEKCGQLGDQKQTFF